MSDRAAQAHCDAVRANQAMKDAELVPALRRELAAALDEIEQLKAKLKVAEEVLHIIATTTEYFPAEKSMAALAKIREAR